jgi:hypothetical protein
MIRAVGRHSLTITLAAAIPANGAMLTAMRSGASGSPWLTGYGLLIAAKGGAGV